MVNKLKAVAIAAVSWSTNRLDVFRVGSTSGGTDLTYTSWGGSSWSGWESLGGSLTSLPTVTAWSANRLDVFVTGTDYAAYHRGWDGSAWSDWENLVRLL